MKNWRHVTQSLVVTGFISTTLASPIATVLAAESDGTDSNAPSLVETQVVDENLEQDTVLKDSPTEETDNQPSLEGAEEMVGDETDPGTSTTEQNQEDGTEKVSADPTDSDRTFSSDGNEETLTDQEIVNVAVQSAEASVEPAASDNVAIQIMGINDFHGALNTTGSYTVNGERIRDLGTAPLLATYLNEAEQAFKEQAETKGLDAHSIRVDAGDHVGASPAVSGLLQDEPTIRALKEMNFSIGTIGNHEFDEGLDEYYRILNGNAPAAGQFEPYIMDYSETNVGPAGMEIVIGNVVEKDGGDIPNEWSPYTIEDFGGIDVGFIGVVTTEIPNLVLKQHYEDYNFLDEAETIEKYSKELRGQGVEAIVVLAHVPAVSAGDIAGGDVADILGRLDASDPEHSVDAVFSGHNHQMVDGVFDGSVSDTLVVQSTSQGKGFVNLTGELNPTTKDFDMIEAEVPLVKPGVTPNTEVEAIVKEAEAIVEIVAAEKIGTATGDITRDVNEYKESPVGNFITDGQLKTARDWGYDADFAMTNNGGIRADLTVSEDGETVTWGAAQAVQPFGNLLQIVEMKGSDVLQVLNEQYDGGQNYFLQLSGLTYTFTESAKEGQEYEVLEVTLPDGSALNLDETYTVVINDFIMGGGDGFAGFTTANKLGEIDRDTDIFISYIEELEAEGVVIDPKIEGRKEYVSIESIIKESTTVPELNTDTTEFGGGTVPKATVEMMLGEMVLSTVADDEGNFTFDLSTVTLKTDDVWTLTVINPDGFAVEYEVTVMAVEEPVDDKDDNKDDDSTDADTETPVKDDGSSDDSSKEKEESKGEQEKLPQTSSQNMGLFSLIGLAFAGSGFAILFKQKKLVNKK